MFRNIDDLHKYVRENYLEVTDSRIDDRHWDLFCTECKIVRGFQVIRRDVEGEKYYTDDIREFEPDYEAPVNFLFRCPVCKAYKLWIMFELDVPNASGARTSYYRVTSIPSEGVEEIEELPDDPPSLRTAYRQAVRAMDANAHIAAALMFRRAVQVITRDLLGAKQGPLASELREVVGREYNGARIRESFSEVGYILKEAGNQAAHPEKDPDLLDFTAEDTQDLQSIFMELVSELFIVPAAMQKAKVEFLARRKILPKS